MLLEHNKVVHNNKIKKANKQINKKDKWEWQIFAQQCGFSESLWFKYSIQDQNLN